MCELPQNSFNHTLAYRSAGQRCFGLLALISRTQVRYIHLPERMILPGSFIPSDKYSYTLAVSLKALRTPKKTPRAFAPRKRPSYATVKYKDNRRLDPKKSVGYISSLKMLLFMSEAY